MIDFFEQLYSVIKNKNRIITQIRFYSLFRISIRLTVNFLLPIYFHITKGNKNYSIGQNNNNGKRYIVSLTSFPARINRVWLVVESILRQTHKPDKLILWLSKEQFDSISILPITLQKQINRGLEIELVEDDIKSHKKYYYAMKKFSNDYIITVDDDVIYGSKLLEYLINQSQLFPNSICCNNAHKVTGNNRNINPYLEWVPIYSYSVPNMYLMPIGIGGVLYPPNSLLVDAFNINLIKDLCPFADDIWLNIMARLNGTYTSKTSYSPTYLPIINFKNTNLHNINVKKGENDIQLNAVRNYYKMHHNIDPFKDILELKADTS